MPLLEDEPYALDDAIDLDDDEEVFVVRFTGEIFRAYSDYAERMEAYLARQWTCKYSGTQNLTMEEALISEIEAQNEILLFPDTHIKPVLEEVHHSTKGIEDVVNSLHARFTKNFIKGEEVVYIPPGRDSEPLSVVVEGVAEPPAMVKQGYQKALKSYKEKVKGTNTLDQWVIKDEPGLDVTAVVVVPYDMSSAADRMAWVDELDRRVLAGKKPRVDSRTAFIDEIDRRIEMTAASSKKTVQQKRLDLIDEIDRRMAAVQPPAKVHTFKPPPKIPDYYLVKVVDDHDMEDSTAGNEILSVPQNQLKRSVQWITKDLIRKFIVSVSEKMGSFKGSPWVVNPQYVDQYSLTRDLPKELEELVRQHDGDTTGGGIVYVDRQTVKKRKKGKIIQETPKNDVEYELRCELGQLVHDGVDAERVKEIKTELRGLLKKYPREDLELLHQIHARESTVEWPTPQSELSEQIPGDLMDEVVSIWQFLQRFGVQLRLSPFSLDDFVMALEHDGPSDSPILLHSMLCLLIHVIDDLEKGHPLYGYVNFVHLEACTRFFGRLAYCDGGGQLTELDRNDPPRPVVEGRKLRSRSQKMVEYDDDNMNDNFCSKCGSVGDLLCCDYDGCNRSYHLKCLRMDNVPEGDWICPKHKQGDDVCHLCESGGQLLLCDLPECDLAYHLSCVELRRVPQGDWICPEHDEIGEDSCHECGRGGSLLLCDHEGCNLAYHIKCIGLRGVPSGEWICPEHEIGEDVCHVCEGEGELLLCDKEGCDLAYHVDCLDIESVPDGKWYCPEHGDVVVEEEEEVEKEVRQERRVVPQVYTKREWIGVSEDTTTHLRSGHPFFSVLIREKIAMFSMITDEAISASETRAFIDHDLDTRAQIRHEHWKLEQELRKIRREHERELKLTVAEREKRKREDSDSEEESEAEMERSTENVTQSRQQSIMKRRLQAMKEEEERRRAYEVERQRQRLLAESRKKEQNAKMMVESYEKEKEERREQFEKDLTRFSVRFAPIGHDRYFRRYWHLQGENGRLFVESAPNDSWMDLVRLTQYETPKSLSDFLKLRCDLDILPGMDAQNTLQSPPVSKIASVNGENQVKWGQYCTPKHLDDLISWLDPRGTREASLLENLQRIRTDLIQGMEEREEQQLKDFQTQEARHSGRFSHVNHMGYENLLHEE